MREAWDRTDFERKKENKRRFKNGKLKEIKIKKNWCNNIEYPFYVKFSCEIWDNGIPTYCTFESEGFIKNKNKS